MSHLSFGMTALGMRGATFFRVLLGLHADGRGICNSCRARRPNSLATGVTFGTCAGHSDSPSHCAEGAVRR